MSQATDVRSFQYFLSVYEAESVSAAAKRCAVSQPTVSAAVAQLEAELGRALFTRHPRGVRPTDAARDLYPHARKVVEDLRRIRELFTAPAPPQAVRVAFMPFLPGARVGAFVRALRAVDPRLELTVVDVDEDADCRVVAGALVRPGEEFTPLWRDHYVLALPEGHALALRDAVAVRDLDGVPFVSRRPCEVIDAWSRELERAGVRPRVRTVVRNEEYALDLVAAGLGVSVVPSQSVSGRPDVATRPLRDLVLERVVGLARPRGAPLPAAVDEAVRRTRSAVSFAA